MESAFDPILMETRYELLRTTLHELSDLLVHSVDDDRLLEVFGHARGTADALFLAEERALGSADRRVTQANRKGHRRFLLALDEVRREAQDRRLGIHAAGVVRREILPWLHEHHVVVDRQLLQRDADEPGDPFRATKG